MRNETVKVAPKSGFTVVLVSKNWKGKRTLKHRGFAETREAAEAIRAGLIGRGSGFNNISEYRVCGPRQLKALLAEIHEEQKGRRKEGAKKAAKTRQKAGPNNFIRCPTCQAKSKKLFSEFGGLWGPVLTGEVKFFW